MDDTKLMAEWEASAGSSAKAALSIGVSPQTWNNWKIPKRGISGEGRLLVWLAINSPNLLRRFLKETGKTL